MGKRVTELSELDVVDQDLQTTEQERKTRVELDVSIFVYLR
jgi:hypothetical protein